MKTEFKGYKSPRQTRYPKAIVCIDDVWIMLTIDEPEYRSTASISLSAKDARALAAVLIAFADQIENN